MNPVTTLMCVGEAVVPEHTVSAQICVSFFAKFDVTVSDFAEVCRWYPQVNCRQRGDEAKGVYACDARSIQGP